MSSKNMLRSKSGAGLTEYGLVAALIAGVALLAVAATGTQTRDVFSRVVGAVGDGSTRSPGGPGSPDAPGGLGAPEAPTGPLSIVLGSAGSIAAGIGEPFAFGFVPFVTLTNAGTITPSSLSWSVGSPGLASWLSFDGNTGVLTGVPDTLGLFPVEIVASHLDASAARVYEIVVGGEVLLARQIDTGPTHACAVTLDHALVCWGANTSGQLGDGTTTQSITPGYVLGLSSGVAKVSVGHDHTCAVLQNGAALCWGANSDGRLGIGTTTGTSVPTPVQGILSGATDIAAGLSHTCAVVSGEVLCWGANGSGQLGNASTSASTVPVAVATLSGATRVAVGRGGSPLADQFSCAVASGAAYCWGGGANGRLGRGSTAGSNVPVSVTGLGSGVTDIALGAGHACAVVSGGVSCWGQNNRAQVGTGATSTQETIPVQVSGVTGATSVAAGASMSCVVAAGAVSCWGSTSGFGAPDMPLPTVVPSLASGATLVSMAGSQTCALRHGVSYCWGSNLSGQVGDGTLVGRSAPTLVRPASGVPGEVGFDVALQTSTLPSARLAEPFSFDFKALLTITNPGARSANDAGWVQTNTAIPGLTLDPSTGILSGIPTQGFLSDQSVGVAVVLDNKRTQRSYTLSVLPGNLAGTGVSVGWFHACDVDGSGRAFCWGNGATGRLGTGDTGNSSTAVVAGIASGATKIGAGDAVTCAIVSGGVRCMGSNVNGQLGVTGISQSSTPIEVVPAGSGVTDLAVGRSHACALVAGAVACWGWTPSGQAGVIRPDNIQATPAIVAGLPTGVTALSAGPDHTCALAAGAVYCWGAGDGNRLGNGHLSHATLIQPTPVLVQGLPGGVDRIAVGHTTACATAAGALYCWGNGLNGNGATGIFATTQVTLPEATTFVGAAEDVCAVGVSGAVRCWGWNSGGVSDPSQPGTTVTTPRLVAGVSGATRVSPGSSATCANTGSGTVCWGNQQNGRLGNGQMASSVAGPAQVLRLQ